MTRFEGFDTVTLDAPRGPIHARRGGSGPPLLLLHGFPQTHLMWHAVAPRLAGSFTVYAVDLPGYGESFRPPVSEDHFNHSKRAWAADLVAAMPHERFGVIGHDRGGRVAYRMALDHPDVVTQLAILDIVPTGELWEHADDKLSIGYWHWGFLAQAAPLPERLINGDPGGFWIAAERMGIGNRPEAFPDAVVAEYRRWADDPATVEAWCEDYRAGATIDRAIDAEGGTIACPVRVLWGAHGALPIFYADPLALWRSIAPEATGRGIDGGSHFLAEDEPDVVADDLLAFLSRA
ncbi:MAG: haloacetate dehalogenase [Solirubrobacteraceae bacterium]|jgi:haloacetate dehalogenase|nr:haloacetate dehalogenase [Solirubrobacteraceae bacterium]